MRKNVSIVYDQIKGLRDVIFPVFRFDLKKCLIRDSLWHTNNGGTTNGTELGAEKIKCVRYFVFLVLINNFQNFKSFHALFSLFFNLRTFHY